MLIYEYKLDGTKAQYAAIDEAIRVCQFIRNKCLRLWQDEQGISSNDLQCYCSELAKQYDFAAHLNPFFVGLIILPIVGNAAEHFTAITAANHNHMEISMAITAGSSIQIALLATPILVLVGAFIGAPLDLNFSLLEVAMFGLVTILYALISLDGVSTWLEGMLLCAFYLILAVGSFFPPA